MLDDKPMRVETSRWRTTLYLAIPPVLCTVLYWNGLNAWFQQDDFAWLGLSRQVHSAHDLGHALFFPMAQGTIRPISERAFFMGFHSLFGLNAIAYRALVFLTQFANLILLSLLTRSLTGSIQIGLWSSVLWCSNSVLWRPLSWTSAYNQILCAFVFLLAVYLLSRYVETGQERYVLLQWGVFLVGFGVLELNVVYPALAITFSFLYAPGYLKRTFALLAPAAVFIALHTYVAPKSSRDVYAIKAGAATILSTLGKYWRWSVWPVQKLPFDLRSHWPIIAFVAITCALLAFVVWQARNRLVLFGLAWFCITLSPYLLLPNHISDYYLTVPTIGLSLVAGSAAVMTWNRGGWVRLLAALLISTFLAASWAVDVNASFHARRDSEQVKQLVLGVAEANRVNPGKMIFVDGVDDSLFRRSFIDHPFQLLGLTQVYLTPDGPAKIKPRPDLGSVDDFTLPAQTVIKSLVEGQAVVYSVEPHGLRNVTNTYARKLATSKSASDYPLRVELGNPAFAYLLDQSWFPIEGNDFRWMPKSAALTMGGPVSAAERLHVRGFCAPAQLKGGPIQLTVILEERRLPPADVTACETPFDLSFAIPADVSKNKIAVTLIVDHTFQAPPDPRRLGLGIEVIEIH